MKKKILALFLCCVMVIGLLPATLAFAAETELKVDADTVSLKTTETKTLTADAGELTGRYQWQIQAGEGVWVNILGANEKTLTLNYGLVASLLLNNTARIRCRMTTDGKTLDSNVVTVEIQHDAAVRKAPAMSPAIGTVVTQATPIGDPVIVPGDTTVPAAEQYVTDNAPVADSAPSSDPVPATDSVTPQSDENDQNEVTPAPTTYTIVIEYKYADGTPAANSWTATVAAGSGYSQSIQSPVVVGYKPDQETVEVNVTDISKDTTYTVTYQPTTVNFTVKHYQQNVTNDEYTLIDTETKEGVTKSVVGGTLHKSYPGFYNLLYVTDAEIAADGSTEVEIFYDRYYYLMNFDLDGGYGVEPIYARYGTPITVGTPTKAGYTFAGWDKEIPKTMPAENTTFTAKWTVDGQAKVTVVVWGENADDENYSYIKNSEIRAEPGEKLTFLICGKEEHTHDDSCVSCGHTHTAYCYGATKQEQPVDGKTNSATENINQFKALTGGTLKNGMVYRVKCDGAFSTPAYDKYYLYYENTWYLVDSGSISGSAVASSKKMNAHGHRLNLDGNDKDQFWVYNSKLSCNHTHNNSCYTCGKTAHKHDTNCFNSPVSMDTTLWRLVKCDEVTVAADGTTIINVYYDRVEYDVKFFTRDRNPTEYTQYRITAKWGQNILNKWPTHNGSSSWYVSSSGSVWQNSIQVMPVGGASFYGPKSGNSSYTASFYVEVLPGENGINHNGVLYKLHHQDTSSSSGTVTDEDHYEIKGFTYKEGTSNGSSFGGAKFYYIRNSHKLEFFNRTGVIDEKTKTVKYEEPLKNYYFEPDYPADLEPNAYVFDGWYTTAGCYEGSEAKIDATMPDSDVILYAKWTPKTHKVTTWLTNEMKTPVNVGDTDSNVQTVAHGTQATKPADPTNGEYVFVGWFYKENGVEKAFDFSMPVNRDLGLYAKWSSNKLVAYTIKYAVKNADGTLTYIADATTGSALAGSTKTFNAKTGTELNADYQTGYFPKTSSHSLTIDIDATKNVFTFVYVAKPEVEYTVKYLEKGTNKELISSKTETTMNAVVTETFKQITGYAPDAYQKRLVLSADENENVIIFWYTKDEIHAPVQVIHWTQNIVGDGYTEYQSSTNLNGEIGKDYSENQLTIPGFTYNTSKSNASGKLTAAGLVLNLYYDRIEYPYEFRFLEQGTDRELADAVTGSARYQAQVTRTALNIPGYTLVSAENQAINIAIEDGTTAVKNVRTFYYTEQTVEIKYKVVGPTGCGTLDNYQESQLKAMTGTPKGSTPTAADGFKFVGWFTDEPCDIRVENVITGAVNSTTNKLTPQRRPKDNLYFAATYYAKFEYDVADLTITKSGCKDIDEEQSFIFDVTGPDGFSKRVVINGDGSVKITGLKIDEYTVTEVTGWSWRYTPTDGKVSQTIELKPTGNTVTFTNTRSNDKWLGGDAYKPNKFEIGNSN